VYDTTRIRQELDFKEPIDEKAAMIALASGSPQNAGQYRRLRRTG
jgi:hypothetical protein